MSRPKIMISSEVDEEDDYIEDSIILKKSTDFSALSSVETEIPKLSVEYFDKNMRDNVWLVEEQEEKIQKEKAERDNQLKKEDLIKKRRENNEFRKPDEKMLLSSKRQKEGEKEKSDHRNKKSKIYDKNKVIFNFDWDPNDDTSQNALRASFEPLLGFGKGLKAGIDEEEQRAASKKYDILLDKRDKQLGLDTKSQISAASKSNSENYQDVTKKRRDEMTDRDWKIFRENHNIIVKGDLSTTPKPIRNWREANLMKELTDIIEITYAKPTSIQMQAIPIGLDRLDMIGLSPTGSGKSVAFLLPLINFLLTFKKNSKNTQRTHTVKADLLSNSDVGPYALVLAPTRELAQQIEEEFIKLTKRLNVKLKSVCLVGGKSIDDQFSTLSRGVDLVVGAPGRTKDCINRSYVAFHNCMFVVIDEADKLIKDGFEEDLKYILDSMITPDDEVRDKELLLRLIENSKIRTMMMFSATMTKVLEKLARTYLKSPCFVQIAQDDNFEIAQYFEIIKTNNSKYDKLRIILKDYKAPIIIFVNHKSSTHEVLKFCERSRYSCTEIHGDKTQDAREKALRGFKNGDYDILISTSLMGRGIDVEGVTCVINFDTPLSLEDYEHRIGRTGRAGKKGTAITFLTDKSNEFASLLCKHLEKKGVPIPEELINASSDNIIYAN